MNKEKSIAIAVRFLHNVYKDDMYAIASIVNADSEYKEKGETKHIIQYLKDTKDFIDELIKDIEQ